MKFSNFGYAVLLSLAVAVASEDQTGLNFTCTVVRSQSVPESVHKLRPSDINVIAAVGDSLTAGMGIYSSSLITVFTQYRGHSFTMGGAVDLSAHTTLPNILKKFNPHLTGYSTGIGGPDGKYAHFNPAVVGERAEGMPDQARKLVQRMKTTLGSSYDTDWKLINVFVGANDVCDYCKFPERFSPENYVKYLRETLDYFHENVPRAYINLILAIDASAVADIQRLSLKCRLLFQTFWCKCASTRPSAEVIDYVRRIQNLTIDLYNAGLYDTRKDFTVVLQPFFRYAYPPVTADGQVDLSYLAPDCFHFRAKAHAISALTLWQNMLEPVGKKIQTVNWKIPHVLSCPTEEHPFLFTRENS